MKIADLKVEPKVEILENGYCDAKHQHIDEDKVVSKDSRLSIRKRSPGKGEELKVELKVEVLRNIDCDARHLAMDRERVSE